MPFKSEKQRKYMWAKKPKVAKKWGEGYQDGGVVKPERKSSLKIYRDIFNSKIKLRKGLLK